MVEKKNIEDLTNLVFGLALTLGAINLVQPTQDDLSELVRIVLKFALSFFVIIWLWWIYNTLVKELDINRRELFGLSVLLLFLIVMEPYLATTTDMVSGATLFAFDLGTVLLILAIFNEYLIKEIPDEDRIESKRRWLFRYSLFLSSVLFYLSIIIGYIPGAQSKGLQNTIWLMIFGFGVMVRLLSGKRTAEKTDST